MYCLHYADKKVRWFKLDIDAPEKLTHRIG